MIGQPGWAYVGGACVLWQGAPYWGAVIVGTLIIARKFRKVGNTFGSLTVPDWLGHRYGSDSVRFLAAIVVLINLFYIGAVIYGIAIVCQMMIGISYVWGLLLGTGIVLFYMFLGGMHAGITTDVVQGVLMGVLGIAMLVLVFTVAGGFGNLTTSLSAIDPNLVRSFNPKFAVFKDIIAGISTAFFGFFFCVQANLANRLFVLRKNRDLAVFAITVALCLFAYYNTIFGGLVAKVALTSSLKRPDEAIPRLLFHAFPPVVASIALAAILSAAMSTVSGLYHAIASIIGIDIYKRTLVEHNILSRRATPEQVEKIALTICRAAIIVVGIVSILIVLKPPKFLATLATAGVFGYLAGAWPAILLGLFWKKAPKWGAIASLISGPITFVVLYSGGIVRSVYTSGFIAVLMGMLLLWVVSVATPGSLPSEDRVASMVLGEKR